MQDHDTGTSRLFLSADLVGSTAFKQRDPEGWLNTTLGFYQQFPSLLAEKLIETSSPDQSASTVIPDPIELWKALGDELVFSCLIKKEAHAAVVIKSFVAALAHWSNEVVSGKNQLALKGGAWVATFPLPDRAIAVMSTPSSLTPAWFDPDKAPEENNRSLIDAIGKGDSSKALWLDFIGPGMDLGFRIVQYASARKFVLSLEAAWLIAEAESETQIYFDGEVELRGFDHGGGYPLFWLDVALQRSGDNILDQIQGLAPVQLSQVCELATALCADKRWPTKLYLPSSNKAHLQVHHDAVEQEVHRLNEIRDTQGQIPDL